MKITFINSVFASITFLVISGCASMTTAPSAPPSATVSIREWSAAYYASAAAGNKLSDFSGTYRGVSRGLTLIEGKMHAKLTNANGVVMYLAGETEGLASSMGAQAFEVNLTD
jgi:hypothetical protein